MTIVVKSWAVAYQTTLLPRALCSQFYYFNLTIIRIVTIIKNRVLSQKLPRDEDGELEFNQYLSEPKSVPLFAVPPKWMQVCRFKQHTVLSIKGKSRNISS